MYCGVVVYIDVVFVGAEAALQPVGSLRDEGKQRGGGDESYKFRTEKHKQWTTPLLSLY